MLAAADTDAAMVERSNRRGDAAGLPSQKHGDKGVLTLKGAKAVLVEQLEPGVAGGMVATGFMILTPERELHFKATNTASSDVSNWVTLINACASWGGKSLPM